MRWWWFRLAVALCGWYAHEDRLDEWVEVCRVVLATPTAEDRPEIAGWAHNQLGVLRRRQHDPREAAAALTLAVAERGRRRTAQPRMNLGLALLDLGQPDDAIEHLELSRRHRSRGYAAALANLVLVHSRLGEHLDAAQPWRAALREYDSLPDLTARATALLNAGRGVRGGGRCGRGSGGGWPTARRPITTAATRPGEVG